MTDPISILSTLRRPSLLVRAARFGLEDYQRDRDLKRVLRLQASPSPRSAISKLLEEEARLESFRTDGGGTYSVSRHVDIMIALMAEIRLRLGSGPATQ